MGEKPDLEFLTETETRPRPGDTVFRERRLGKFLLSVLFFALTGGFAAGAWLAVSQRGLGMVLGAFLVVMTVVLLFMFLIALASFRASRRPTNWLLRATVEGLFIHYRSYLNSGFPADSPTVVLLPHREIDWIRGSHQKQSRGLPDDTVTERRHYLEIGLRRRDLSDLEKMLADGRTLTLSARSRFNHYPIAVVGNAIRLEWLSPRTATHPGLRKALEILGRDYPVIPGHAEILDDNRVTDPGEQQDRIRGHLARGEVMTAIKLAREYFGYDLLTARNYVDDLKEKL